MAESDAAGVTEQVVLRMCLDPGDPPSGTVGLDDRGADTRFSGWVELMAAITTLRSAPGRAARQV